MNPPASFTFDTYIPWLFSWEGTDFENDPDDPGGATKYGIDQRSHPDVNIRSLTAEQAKAIYWEGYWLPSAGDKLPGRVAWAVTDCRVNCGPRASKWLQQAVGAVQDGLIGPKTIAAVAQWETGQLNVAGRLLDFRESYYRDLGRQDRFKKFLKGWLNRNDDLRRMLA